MELARAYNNLADPSEPGGKEMLSQGTGIDEVLEGGNSRDTNSWNFRMGYAYYYLDQEGPRPAVF